MYTSYIGRKFLKLYNEKFKISLKPREFFDSVQFPIFFDNPRHLMHVHGSTFFQKISGSENANERESLLRLKRLHNDVENLKISASIYVGYAAEKTIGVTSGQVSSIKNMVDEDEIYASWIGAGLGIGLEGRFNFLSDRMEIIWIVFEGWKFYRAYLEQTPNIKDKEVEIWNAWWLINCLKSGYAPGNPGDNLSIETETSMGETRIKKKSWSEIMLALSKKFSSQEEWTIYGYQLDKTNTTLGFINVYLKELHEMYELRDQIFIDKSTTILSDREIEQLQTFYNFKSACQIGTIGLKSLEPAQLRNYIPKGCMLYAQGKEFKFDNEESYTHYKLYKIWITAMLNKTELLQLASSIAQSLVSIEAKDERGQKAYSRLSKEVRESKLLPEFIEKLTTVLNELPEHADMLKECVVQALEMPSDRFPLFIVLIRFEYAYQKTKN